MGIRKAGEVGATGLLGLLAALQSDDSEASVASLAKRGLSLLRDDIKTPGRDFENYLLKDGDSTVGGMALDDLAAYLPGGNNAAVDNVNINFDLQGKGIGSEFYDAVQEVSGKELFPSTSLNNNSARVWANRDPEKLDNLAANIDADHPDGPPHQLWKTREAIRDQRGSATPGAMAAAGVPAAGILAYDPTAPLPAPDFATQMGKAGEVLGTIADAPMQGLQGMGRGIMGLLQGEDLATAGAQANHLMKGGPQEGYDRFGKKVEGLFAPIDKQFPYLNVGKSAGDTVSTLLSLISPF